MHFSRMERNAKFFPFFRFLLVCIPRRNRSKIIARANFSLFSGYDDCIDDDLPVSWRKRAPLFVAYRYVARQDSGRLIRGSAGRGKAPFNAFRTDIYPALSQWKLIAWLSNSLLPNHSSFFLSLSRESNVRYRFQEILEQIEQSF